MGTPVLSLAVVLLAVSGVPAGPVGKGPRPAPAQGPAAPSTGMGTAAALTPAEHACLSNKKLLYPGDNKCYQLLSTGPCKPHEWLVLDAANPLRPVCARVPCGERETLWPGDGRCYQRFRDRETLCPHQGNLLVDNPFGLGECVCTRTTPHARDANNLRDGACYQLYHRGPCPEGQLFVPKQNGTADQGVCARDPCQQPRPRPQAQPAYGHGDGEDAQAQARPTQTAMPMVLWPVDAGGDGKCHALGSTCPDKTSNFAVHPQTLRPGCINRQLHLLPPTPCSGDRCTPTNTAAYSEGYIKELLQAHKAHRAQKRARRRLNNAAAVARSAARSGTIDEQYWP